MVTVAELGDLQKEQIAVEAVKMVSVFEAVADGKSANAVFSGTDLPHGASRVSDR